MHKLIPVCQEIESIIDRYSMDELLVATKAVCHKLSRECMQDDNPESAETWAEMERAMRRCLRVARKVGV